MGALECWECVAAARKTLDIQIQSCSSRRALDGSSSYYYSNMSNMGRRLVRWQLSSVRTVIRYVGV
jgi:hypothetical protein